MAKLNSEQIKKIVAEQAELFNEQFYSYEAEREEEKLSIPILWKRISKKRSLYDAR